MAGVFGMFLGVPIAAVCTYLVSKLINHMLQKKQKKSFLTLFGLFLLTLLHKKFIVICTAKKL